MYTIWKYEIEPDFVNQVYMMPAESVILSFGLDANNNLCFWARVNDAAPMVEHAVACIGTGWPLETIFNERANKYVCFIGSVTHGSYVWHLFDLGARSCSSNDESTLIKTDKEMST